MKYRRVLLYSRYINLCVTSSIEFWTVNAAYLALFCLDGMPSALTGRNVSIRKAEIASLEEGWECTLSESNGKNVSRLSSGIRKKTCRPTDQ